MFFDRSFQTQLIQDDLRKSHRRPYSFKPQKTKVQLIREKVRAYFVLFLETSSIHGLNHLVAARRHLFEILLWLMIVCLSVYGATSLSSITWTRYQNSPTVVSMDRDMYAWNTTFPCVTICPDTKLDSKKLEAYVESSPETDKEKLKDFILKLANATYNNFDDIPDYFAIAPESYMELILNLSRGFQPTLTIGATWINLKIIPTVTEMGLCYAINSKVAVYNTPQYWAENKWDFIEIPENQTFFVHPLDGEVFAQVINLSTSYDVYIHGPVEFPDISSKHQHSAQDFYMKLYVTALTVYSSPEATKLSVSQRRCRFPQENNLHHSAVYSYNMCRMECRIKLCMKYCHCIPHFYRRIANDRVCNVTELKCLSKHKEELYKLMKSGKKLDCGCLPNCDDVNYVIQSNVLQHWFLGTNLQWGIVTYPRMRYRRDIIFGFTDVLVSVGGMAGLFLGCSVLSFMEIVYFLSLRLAFYTRSNIKK